MRRLLIAFQFLTILPLPPVRCDEEDLGRSMAWFPLVGLSLGALLAGADFLLGPLLPRGVGDLLLLTLLTVVTGALHLDGLSDVCDGIAARGPRERFLEIMKDSRVGAVGAVGLVVGILLKYQALLALPPEQKRAALFFFPTAARFAQVQMTVGAKRARKDGLGCAFVGGAGAFQLVSAGLFAVAAAWFFLGVPGLATLLLVFSLTWLIKGWAHGRLGGITGDVIGCASELAEIFSLLCLLALWRQGLR